MQDNRFSVELLYQAHKIYVLPKKLIYYRSCDCSTTNFTLKKDKNAPHFFDVGKELGENKKSCTRAICSTEQPCAKATLARLHR